MVDAQLPPALARLLRNVGHEADHVSDVGLAAGSDALIWDFASRHAAVIVTKDEDFAIQRLGGRQGAAIVWLRMGNCTRAELARWFMPLLPRIVALIEGGEAVVEVR